MEPWLEEFAAGRTQAAWDLFVERYRRLIFATICRLVRDHDDVMDVFSAVCEALYADDLARLRRFVDQPTRARFSTWLVAVVRNLAIDWLRKRDGRRRISIPESLSPLQRALYVAVFLEDRSHLEAYESICAASDPPITFREFLRELRVMYRFRGRAWATEARRPPLELTADIAAPNTDAFAASDTRQRIASAIAALRPADQLAIELFVMEGVNASEVARLLGWSSAKAVYNRVYRALTALRAELAKVGIGAEDLL